MVPTAVVPAVPVAPVDGRIERTLLTPIEDADAAGADGRVREAATLVVDPGVIFDFCRPSPAKSLFCDF